MKYSKVAALLAMLASMLALAPVPAAAASQPANCPAAPLTHSLTIGSRDAATGGEVSELQALLGALLPVAPTGYFGPLTAHAVARWQLANNVAPASGYVGPLTRAAIERYCGQAPATVTAACPTVAITHNLSLGTTDTAVGGDVSSLQTFLGLPATGYFDATTKQSAASWQAANGVAPAVGYVGPLTRAAILRHCTAGGVRDNNVSFTATPTSGTAPLAVAFAASGSDLGKGQYIVDYGDGASSGPVSSYCTTVAGATTTSCSVQAGHTYQSAGAYTAALEPYIACMWSTPHCDLAVQTLGSATVTVGKVATVGTLHIPGSITLAPGASARQNNTYTTYTLTVNSTSVANLSANVTWTESHCGTAGCLGAADPAPQTVTLYLSGGASSYTTALGHVITVTAVAGSSASFDISQ